MTQEERDIAFERQREARIARDLQAGMLAKAKTRAWSGAPGDEDVDDGEILELCAELVTDEAGKKGVILRLAERSASELEPVPGSAGVTGYRSGGVATNLDKNRTFRPYRARGIGRDFGLYHQAFLECESYQDAWSKIYQGLSTGYWWVKPVTCEDKAVQRRADAQAKAVERVLFGIRGGWKGHVRESLYKMIGGFAPFIRELDGWGQLVALSFRYPSQVQRWITDPSEAELLGIEFRSSNAEAPYRVPAASLLLYQHMAIGNNWEGISPMRAVVKFMQWHDLFCQLESCAAEKYGAPVTFIERPEGKSDASDDDALLEILDAMVATDDPVILLPGGYKVTVASPAGQVPDFEPIKRYYDEKIKEVLSAEGSLVGMNGMGSYSMAEIKDDQALRSLFYYSGEICDVINGQNTPYTGVIGPIVAALIDPELNEPIEGQLPQLCWALSPEQDETGVDQVLSALSAGALKSWSDEDEDWLRTKFKMPARRVAQVAQDVTQEDA